MILEKTWIPPLIDYTFSKNLTVELVDNIKQAFDIADTNKNPRVVR